MWPAFRPRTTTDPPSRPGAINRQRTCPPPPEGGGGGDTGTVPTFTTSRSTGSAPSSSPSSIATSTPQTFLAASPPAALDRLRSPRPPTTARAACAALRPTSTRLEPASLLRGFNHWFTSVTPFPSRSTSTGPSGGAGPPRLHRGCSRPRPRFRGQAAASFIRAAATARRRSPFISARFVAPRGAQCGSDAHGQRPPARRTQKPRTYGPNPCASPNPHPAPRKLGTKPAQPTKRAPVTRPESPTITPGASDSPAGRLPRQRERGGQRGVGDP